MKRIEKIIVEGSDLFKLNDFRKKINKAKRELIKEGCEPNSFSIDVETETEIYSDYSYPVITLVGFKK